MLVCSLAPFSHIAKVFKVDLGKKTTWLHLLNTFLHLIKDFNLSFNARTLSFLLQDKSAMRRLM